LIDIEEEGVGDVLGRCVISQEEELVCIGASVLGITLIRVRGMHFSDIYNPIIHFHKSS